MYIRILPLIHYPTLHSRHAMINSLHRMDSSSLHRMLMCLHHSVDGQISFLPHPIHSSLKAYSLLKLHLIPLSFHSSTSSLPLPREVNLRCISLLLEMITLYVDGVTFHGTPSVVLCHIQVNPPPSFSLKEHTPVKRIQSPPLPLSLSTAKEHLLGLMHPASIHSGLPSLPLSMDSV